MQEELDQFERNGGLGLVPRSKNHAVVCTKWVFRNKKDENDIIVKNKLCLVT